MPTVVWTETVTVPQPQRTKVLPGRELSSTVARFEFHALSLVLNQFLPSNPPQARTTLMADLLASYNGLSASSPRADVSKVLDAIISCA